VNVHFTLNGRTASADVRPGLTLLDYLRRMGLFGVKFSSERSETGSDTVLINDQPFNAGLILMHTVEGKRVETIESLSQGTEVHPLQTVFLDEGAIQCGYCTPGMILAVEGLLRRKAHPSEGEIREALAGVYCRCTGYVKPVKAVLNYCSQRKGSSG
jgi:putative selenate reductase molybdopterin-binding subunit